MSHDDKRFEVHPDRHQHLREKHDATLAAAREHLEEVESNTNDFVFSTVWATVDIETDDNISDDDPVLQPIGRATQLEVRQ